MKVILSILLILTASSCLEKKDTLKSKIIDNKPQESKMRIKKQLLIGTDYNEILYALTENCFPDYDDKNFSQLDEVTQTFVLVVNMDNQVMNGGIVQFIDNSTGNYFHETIDALKRIESDGFVKILNDAANQFPNNRIPVNWNLRRQLLDQIGEKYITRGAEYDIVDEKWEEFWDDLDSYYYDNSNILYQDLVRYLKENAEVVN